MTGFTLIELLVSVAIVGILVAVSITSYEIYKNYAYDAERHIFFHDLRVSLEARDKDDLAPGQYYNVYRNFNTTTWYESAGITKEELLPGLNYDTVASHYYPAVVIRNCMGQASPCHAQWLQLGDCRDGEYSRWLVYGTGAVSETTGTYYAPYDAAC